MHIAFWSPAWPLEKFQNGIVTYVHWMKVALESKGHRVSVFTKNLGESPDPTAATGVQIVNRSVRDRFLDRLMSLVTPSENRAFEFSRVMAAHLQKYNKRDPIDILEMEESFGWFSDIERRTSLPLVVKLHGPAFLSLVPEEIETPFGREKIAREGRALRRASVVISPSARTLAQTIEFYGLNPEYQAHIVNPLEMPAGTPLWDLESCNRNTILCVGRFDLRKGADVLLNAFRGALRDRPDLKLVFVGPDRGVLMADGRLLNFEEYVRGLFTAEQRDHVEFRGTLPNAEIMRLRTEAMMTIVASRWENQSYAVLEAMLQGCPVVCSDAGGCPESVADGRTGLLARSGDPDSFRDKILQMLDDPAAAAAMGQAARQYVLEEHSAAKVAEQSLRLYEDLIRSA